MKYLIRYSTSKQAELLEFDVPSISDFEQSEFIRDIRECMDGCEAVGNSYSLPVTDELKAGYIRLLQKYWEKYAPICNAVYLLEQSNVGEELTIIFNTDWRIGYEYKLRRPFVQSYGRGCENMVLEDIRKVIDEHIPPMLFRLFPCEEYAFKGLLEDTAGTTSSITFNDPFDTMPMLDGDFLLQRIKKWWKIELAQMYEVWKDNSKIDEYFHTSEKGKQKILNNIRKISSEDYFVERITNEDFAIKESMATTAKVHFDTLLDIQKHTFVGCFTENVDNVLMWSQYARSHSCFALGYDFRLPENQIAKEMLFPVVYSNEKIDMTMDVGFVADQNVAADYNYSVDILCGPKSSLFKSLDWAYEKEWRYTVRDIENEGMYGSIPLKPSAIYYGCKITKEHFAILHHFAKLKGLKEYRMEISPFDKEYKMNIIEMTE